LSKNKTLCGSIDPNQPLDIMTGLKPSQSQWTNACTSGGQYCYPYGAHYQEGACRLNSPQPSAAAMEPNQCQTDPSGEYAGIVDMIGNVGEWEDACNNDGQCLIRGGNFFTTYNQPAALQCSPDDNSKVHQHRVSYFKDNVGFRCCYTPN